jgi:hypothetical protein
MYLTERMQRFFLCLLIVALLVGCGYDPEKKVYDTAKNPDGFPSKALQLVDGVESEQLASFDTITTFFADLYTEHPQLLDNPDWRVVVGRLGAKFKFKAEQLSAQGPSMFDRAADFYTLATFARPDDQRLAARKSLFATWEKAQDDSLVSPALMSESHPATLAQKLPLLKYFMLSDSTHRQFGQEYLLPQLLDVRTVSTALKSDSESGLATPDRCFLLNLGFKGRVPATTLATFAEPKIDLVSVRISHQNGNWYAAEMYFMPRERISADFHVAFRLAVADSSKINFSTLRMLDFLPEDRSSSWKPGAMAAAYRRFTYDGPPMYVQVGLYEKSADSVHFVPLRDSGSLMYLGSPDLFAR